jgi:hypothetical protein
MKNIINGTGKFLAVKARELAEKAKYPVVYTDMECALKYGDFLEASVRIGMVINHETGVRLDKLNYIRQTLRETIMGMPFMR